MKYCVIGAGPCGLVATRQLVGRGIPTVCFEREDDIGGNWYFGSGHSSVYASTHLISSKRMTEFTDFPMPKSFPPYPHHSQALQYLRDYADHFQLRDHIRLQTEITNIELREDGCRITTRDLQTQAECEADYAGLIVANGHHRDPLTPQFPGDFSGQTIHARDYKTPDTLKGKRVLVVGAGNSGCDIAVESCQHAESTLLSMRRGYHFLPKFLFGKPADSCGEWLHRWRLPLWLYRKLAGLSLRVSIGPPENYGLPKPEHALFETHPVINSQLPYFVGHGRVQVKPNIKRFEGDSVIFDDDTSAVADLIIYATGYKLSFPFMDSSVLIDQQQRPLLFLNTFHSQRDDLFVVGMLQPNSGIWGLADYQSQLIANFLVARHRKTDRYQWFSKLKSSRPDLSSGISYLKSPRHNLEVEYYGYRKQLQRLLKKFGGTAEMSWAD